MSHDLNLQDDYDDVVDKKREKKGRMPYVHLPLYYMIIIIIRTGKKIIRVFEKKNLNFSRMDFENQKREKKILLINFNQPHAKKNFEFLKKEIIK